MGVTVLNDLTEESPLLGEDEAGNDRDKTYLSKLLLYCGQAVVTQKKAAEEKSKLLHKLDSLMNSEPQQQVILIS